MLLCLESDSAFAYFSGPVISILDGDSIEVLNGHYAECIRLSGIDCPEKGQAFGNKAKQAVSALAFGKDVILQTHGQDKYKRTLVDVLLLDGMNLNQELVKWGWYWGYRCLRQGIRSPLGPMPDKLVGHCKGESMFWNLRGRVKATIQPPGGTASVYP